MIQKQVQLLLDKPMDRKEFLTCIGKGFLLVVGVSAMLKGLANFTEQSGKTTVINRIHENLGAVHGFGSSKFGA